MFARSLARWSCRVPRLAARAEEDGRLGPIFLAYLVTLYSVYACRRCSRTRARVDAIYL